MKKFLSILLSTVLLVSLSISAPFSTKAEASSNVDDFIDAALAADGFTINGVSYNAVDCYAMDPNTFIAAIGGVNDTYVWSDGKKQDGYLYPWNQMKKSRFVGSNAYVYEYPSDLGLDIFAQFNHNDFTTGKQNYDVEGITYLVTLAQSCNVIGVQKIMGESSIFLTTRSGEFMTPYVDIENSAILTNYLQANNINNLEDLRNYLGFTAYSDSNSGTTVIEPFDTKRGDGNFTGTYIMYDDSIAIRVMTDIPNVYVSMQITDYGQMMIRYCYSYLQ